MTITCAHASGEVLTLYYYNELQGEERARFAAHLASCESCARALAELDIVREALSSRADSPRSAAQWAAFMTRLDRAIDADAPADFSHAPAKVVTLPRRYLARYPVFAVAAALFIGVAIGLMWQRRTLDPSSPSSAGSAAPALTAAERHLDRARLVVLGLAARDAAAVEASDWDYERELAAALLPDTRLFRMAAGDRGDARLADLLGDLETVLLQTSMSTEPDSPGLRRLQRLIERRDLIGRMDLRDTTSPRMTGATPGFRGQPDTPVRGL